MSDARSGPVCCKDMRHHLSARCAACLAEGRTCSDEIVRRWSNGTIGIPIHDGGPSMVVIAYCPWCGTRTDQGES